MAKPQTAKKPKVAQAPPHRAASTKAGKNNRPSVVHSAKTHLAGQLPRARGAGKPAAEGAVVTDSPHFTVQQLLAKGDVIPKNWRETRSCRVAKLSKTDLELFLRELLRKRAEILGDVTSMEDEALHRTGSGDLSNMPIHMAELGSDNYEQEFTLNLLEHEQKMLDEIDEAIIRISEGEFGICAATGKPIGKPRLQAKPWAKHCIEYVREQERRGLM